jgi:hypothetical protein
MIIKLPTVPRELIAAYKLALNIDGIIIMMSNATIRRMILVGI